MRRDTSAAHEQAVPDSMTALQAAETLLSCIPCRLGQPDTASQPASNNADSQTHGHMNTELTAAHRAGPHCSYV